MIKLPILIVTIVLAQSCDGPEATKRRQAVVNLCEARGGVPILNQIGDDILRCDFPTLNMPRVEKQ